jgi:hypothetical protein
MYSSARKYCVAVAAITIPHSLYKPNATFLTKTMPIEMKYSLCAAHFENAESAWESFNDFRDILVRMN